MTETESPAIGSVTGRSPWPALTLREVEDWLCAPGARFEMETVLIDGIATRSWKHLPTSLAALAGTLRVQHGDRLFVVYGEERVTYEAWFRAVATLAHTLRRHGIGPGDRVAVLMRNLPEWPVAFFAAIACGAIAVPLNAWWSSEELRYSLSHSGAKILICDGERWDRVQSIVADLPDLVLALVSRGGNLRTPAIALESILGSPERYATLAARGLPDVEIGPEDSATIFYTSGTSGRPKGALGSHRNMLTCMLSSDYARQRMLLRRGETPGPPEPSVGLTVVPMFHVTACTAMLMGTLAAGGSLVFMDKWDAAKALELIEREKVNATLGVPTIGWQLLEHPDRDKYDLSSLTAISYGGAPAAPELARRISQDLGLTPGFGWGMTETSATVTVHFGEDYLHRPESCGPPLPVSDLKIMSLDGAHELAAGEAGELWAAGPQIVKGYWNDPEATAATFVDGWVRTGDIARLDNEGFCYIVDRAKDVIIRGGENIYSIEVENILFEHPGVIDAALIGLPHRTLGEVPAAVVQLAQGQEATEASLQAWVRNRLAAFKTPTRILFSAEALPRNANGKILKTVLAGWFEPETQSGSGSRDSSPPTHLRSLP